MKKIYIIIAFLGVLFSSCRELVQDEFPEFANKVTVNTIISAGDSVRIYLAYTDELNENPLETIDNADVTMYDQTGALIDFTYLGNGEYISGYIAREKDSFNLSVAVPDKDFVTSTCVVPQSIEIADADVEPYGWVDEEGIASPLVHVKIKNDINKAIYGVVYARIYFEVPSGPTTTGYIIAQDFRPIGTIDNINEYGEFIEQELGIIRTRFFQQYDFNGISVGIEDGRLQLLYISE